VKVGDPIAGVTVEDSYSTTKETWRASTDIKFGTGGIWVNTHLKASSPGANRTSGLVMPDYSAAQTGTMNTLKLSVRARVDTGGNNIFVGFARALAADGQYVWTGNTATDQTLADGGQIWFSLIGEDFEYGEGIRSNTTFSDTETFTGAAPKDQWHDVVLTYNLDDNTSNVWLNGVQKITDREVVGKVGSGFDPYIGAGLGGLFLHSTNSIGYSDTTQIDSVKLELIPEPATWVILAAGLTTLVVFRRRHRA